MKQHDYHTDHLSQFKQSLSFLIPVSQLGFKRLWKAQLEYAFEQRTNTRHTQKLKNQEKNDILIIYKFVCSFWF